jgi:hypothetical protein
MRYQFRNPDPLPRHPPLICPKIQIGDFLRELHETLLSLESSTSTLDDVLPAMDYILELFETKKVEFKDDPVLGPCINSGWSKLVKYYEKTSDSPAYVAALVLNPAYKWEYIDKNWEQTWIQGARESVAGLWKAKYRPSTTLINQIDTPSSTKASNFNQWKQGKHASRYVFTQAPKASLTSV